MKSGAVKPNLKSDLGDRLFWMPSEEEIKQARQRMSTFNMHVTH